MTARFLIALFLTAFITTACSNSDDSEQKAEVIRPVKTITVKVSEPDNTRSYPATVLPSQQAELSFNVSGQILELPAKAAAQVKEDDILAKLDTRDLESQVRSLESQKEQADAQLEAMISGARSEDIAALKANIYAAEAQVDAAREQMNRTKRLFDKGIVAKAKLDGDVANLKVTEAQLEAARQELIKGESGSRKEDVAGQIAAIRVIETNLNSAKDSLSDATLRAPFDGIIARRDVDNFANIQAKQTILIVQKLDQLELSFDMPGPDVAKVSRENPPELNAKLDAVAGKVFDATFVEFSTLADTATQTYRGRVSIDPPEGLTILPGMTGQVLVTDPNNQDAVLQVPGTALASDPSGNSFVWVVKDGVVSKRAVKAANASGADITIASGLVEGDVVVTAGISSLQEGMKVKSASGDGS